MASTLCGASSLVAVSNPSAFSVKSSPVIKASTGFKPVIRLRSGSGLVIPGRVSGVQQLKCKPQRRLSPSCKLSEGDSLPPFNLKDQDGRVVTSSKFKSKPLVLYFYPADESPGCTKQACAFRDSYQKFKKAGAEVVGISADSPESHKAFAKKYNLPFTLLTDEGNKLRKQWGIPGDLFGTLPGRQTYVFDKKGVVQLVFNNQFQPEKHVNETLKVLQST